jgi:thiol:disulfide interchange protein DsbC
MTLAIFRRLLFVSFFIFFSAFWGERADAFSDKGCEGDCKKCHSLTEKEVKTILKQIKLEDVKVLNVQLSPVKSLWEISIDNKNKKGLIYVDISKKYIVAGNIIEVSTGINKTNEAFEKINKVDVSKVPLANALVLGDPNAKKKVIVFTDPDCPYCGKLHQEMKQVVKKRKDIAFYMKLYPLPMHKEAYWKAKAAVCSKSIKLLEDNFDKKEIAKKDCSTKEIDDNIKLAASLGITGTPALIMPDGRLHSGTMSADKLIESIDKVVK